MNIIIDLNFNIFLIIISIFIVLNLYLVIKFIRLKSSFFFFGKVDIILKLEKNIVVKNEDSIGVVI